MHKDICKTIHKQQNIYGMYTKKSNDYNEYEFYYVYSIYIEWKTYVESYIISKMHTVCIQDLDVK